ncbi:hypothetical protein KEU06_09695 [Pseudaminobacter sp. 19-2017]|uniref:Uncharacterized protein n=1 Tax=Pseudaminobacter soli (ex Zhang et al. 2022) TaxID=2831468 RepID=A0A942DWD9_9HYPH|nr:hypothetical protein [Pseudaminobacter soli]MBS3648879.1 hypothetical protein [Pseudaminobacter soli]
MVAAADVKWRLSGGVANNNPHASLGGEMSAVDVTPGVLNNLFDPVSSPEAQNGKTEYRCVYVLNNHASDTLIDVRAYIQAQTPNTGTTIDIALAPTSGAAPTGSENRTPADPSAGLQATAGNLQSNMVWYCVDYAPELGLFVALSLGGGTSSDVRAATSPDGLNWTAAGATADITKNCNWRDISWSPKLKLFAGVADSGTTRIAISADGVSWGQRVTNYIVKGVKWFPELDAFLYVRLATNHFVGVSHDGMDWSVGVQSPVALGDKIGFAYSPPLGRTVICGGTSIIHSTTPLEGGWVAGITVPSANFSGVAWSPKLGMFIASNSGSGGSKLYKSVDGINWTPLITYAFPPVLYHANWSEGLSAFVVCGLSFAAMSFDGVVWTEITVPASTGYQRLLPVGTKTYTVGNTGTARNYVLEAPELVFSSPADAENGLEIGDLGPGQRRAVWVRRTVSPGAPAVANDPFTLAIRGFPPLA